MLRALGTFTTLLAYLQFTLELLENFQHTLGDLHPTLKNLKHLHSPHWAPLPDPWGA